MNMLHRRYILLFLGLVILIWTGGVRDVNAQSISLDNVTVVRGTFPIVQVNFSFEGLDGYDIDNDGLVVFVSKYTFDPEDNEMKYMPYDTIVSSSDNFIAMMDDGEFYYLDVVSNHDNEPERYTLRLEDFSETILGFLTPGHQTIFLNEVNADQIDICFRAISLHWDNYGVYSLSGETADEQEDPFFTHNLIMYLYVEPGGVDQVADTLNFDSLTYDFVFTEGPGRYDIWVQAVEMDGDGEILRYSNSNFRSVVFRSPVLTDLEITRVDVINNRDIEVVFVAEGGQPGDLDDFVFYVYRSDSLDGDYSRLDGDVNLIDGGASSVTRSYSFTDDNVPDIQSGPYYYRVVAHLVECDEEFMVSPVVSSLFLEGDISLYTEDILHVDLEGAHYPGEMVYQLYRKLPWDDDWQPIDISGFGLYFEDNLSMYIDSLAGDIFYRLGAISATDTVFSNEVILSVNVGLDVYNAFRPSSNIIGVNGTYVNRTFKPRLRGVTPTLFRVLIYNNWGQEIYSYTSQSGPLDDWDGWEGRTADGSEVPAGVYGYKIEYQVRDGERVEKRGLVTLIR